MLSFGKYSYGNPTIIWETNNSKLRVGIFFLKGNPRKHIKYRFTEKQIEALLKRWYWDNDKINMFLY
jgi:hypothetical protein